MMNKKIWQPDSGNTIVLLERLIGPLAKKIPVDNKGNKYQPEKINKSKDMGEGLYHVLEGFEDN